MRVMQWATQASPVEPQASAAAGRPSTGGFRRHLSRIALWQFAPDLGALQMASAVSRRECKPVRPQRAMFRAMSMIMSS